MYNALNNSGWLGTGLAARTRSTGPATVKARLRQGHSHVYGDVSPRRLGARQLA